MFLWLVGALVGLLWTIVGADVLIHRDWPEHGWLRKPGMSRAVLFGASRRQPGRKMEVFSSIVALALGAVMTVVGIASFVGV